MQNLTSIITEYTTSRRNNFRYDCYLSVEAGIRAAETHSKAVMFLKLCFEYLNIQQLSSICTRVRAGEPFLVVMDQTTS